MPPSNSRECQIVAILKQQEGGLKIAGICRTYGSGAPTYQRVA